MVTIRRRDGQNGMCVQQIFLHRMDMLCTLNIENSRAKQINESILILFFFCILSEGYASLRGTEGPNQDLLAARSGRGPAPNGGAHGGRHKGELRHRHQRRR